ncbi:MAG: hypothetical protein MJ198_09815 [Bacteroidales bacterium]|nr:hypothetical protein [Bacteroidales bacterium]
MENPALLSVAESKKLLSLINDYPYFQTARSLYAKSQQNNEVVDFNEILKLTATYAVDRSKLYELMKSSEQEEAFEDEVELFSEECGTDETIEEVQEEKSNSTQVFSFVDEEPEKDDSEVVSVLEAEVENEKNEEVVEVISNETVQEQAVKEVPQVEEKVIQEPELEPVVDAVSEELADNNVEENSSATEENSPLEEKTVAPAIEEIKETENIQPVKQESLADRILRECREKKEREAERLRSLQKPAEQEASPMPETPVVEQQVKSVEPPSDDLLDFSSFGEIQSTENAVTEEKKSSIGVIDFNVFQEVEQHDWFERSEKKTNDSAMDLINKFIENDPEMPKLQFSIGEYSENEKVSDLSKTNSENQGCLTESMAKIYAKQHLFAKAIEIYEKLSLKYPEKSVYFANRISELKENKK